MKRYNVINSRRKHRGMILSPKVSIQRSGRFRLNKALLDILEASIGDGVELMCDDAGEWYVSKAKMEGIKLYRSSSKSCEFFSRIAADAIFQEIDADSGTFLVSKIPHVFDGQKCYSILLSSRA